MKEQQGSPGRRNPPARPGRPRPGTGRAPRSLQPWQSCGQTEEDRAGLATGSGPGSPEAQHTVWVSTHRPESGLEARGSAAGGRRAEPRACSGSGVSALGLPGLEAANGL